MSRRKWAAVASVLAFSSLSACIGEEPEDDTSDVGFFSEPLAGLTIESMLPSRGTTRIEVPLDPGTNDLVMGSWVAGRWRFKTWNTRLGTNSCLSAGGFPPEVDTIVFTSWKNLSNPRDTWHEWPGGGPVCRLSMFSTIFNSGSRYIAYKLSYEHSSYSTTVTAEFTKL
jgi:hypothetical protein